MGGEFFANSAGITDTFAVGIYALAGFPDPTVCGEKYAATGGALYRQGWTDTTWEPIITSIDAEGWGIRVVKTKEDVGGIVMVGGMEGFSGIMLRKSLDFGETWDHLYPTYPVMALDFSVNATYDDIEYVFTTDGYVVSRSLDGGGSWETVFTEEYVHYFRTVLYDLYWETLFAAGYIGGPPAGHLLISRNLGNSWQVIPVDGLDNIVDIALAGDGYLYLAARNGGIYRLNMNTLLVGPNEHRPAAFTLHAPYPNPFNAIITLGYELPRAVPMELVIYDVLGQEVYRLGPDLMEIGYHKLPWDAHDADGRELSSGIYIARFVTPEASRSVKLVLLK
jgi:hypothetical protein